MVHREPYRGGGQPFTAGLTGDLDQVDLALLRIPPSSLDLIVEIRSVSAGAPDGVLASATIAAAAIPASPNIAFVSATFSPPAPVTKDNQYAIVAYASGSDNYGWGLDIFSNPYAGGQFFASFASPPAAWISAPPEWDHAFKTYVVERFAFTFTGFLTPVENPPTVNGVNSGAGVPLEFSLGGDQGLDIFRPGFPQVQVVACPGAATNDVPTTAAGNSSLQYNPRTDVYTYVWKTDKAWAGQCGQLELGLIDGSTHTALFQFR